MVDRPQTMLRALLLDILSEGELRRLLFDMHGPGIGQSLPWGAPAEEVFFAAVEALGRRGLILPELFQRLVAHAPVKCDEILAVARACGAAPGAGIAILEALQESMRGPNPAEILTLVRNHAAFFFPPSGDVNIQGRVESTVAVTSDLGVMTVERVRTRQWSTGLVEHRYYAVLGREITVLRADGAAPHRWALTAESAALIEHHRRRYVARDAPYLHDGDLYVFLGSRAEIGAGEKLTAWSDIKARHAVMGIFLRTMEGMIDQLASSALGDRWYAGIPASSPLAQPL